jgi:putative transposase
MMSVQRRHRRNYNETGHAHELTFSCYHGYAFLKAERTCKWLADSINVARIELQFDLWSFVFMPDHAHLVICPRQHFYNVAAIRSPIKHPTSKVALAWLRANAPHWLPLLTGRAENEPRLRSGNPAADTIAILIPRRRSSK